MVSSIITLTVIIFASLIDRNVAARYVATTPALLVYLTLFFRCTSFIQYL